MDHWKRAAFFLALNFLVSAFATLTVLLVWDKTHPQPVIPDSAFVPQSGGSPAVVVAAPTNPSGSPIPQASTTSGPLVDEYVVREDDTLGEISKKYGLSVDAILKANGLKDPNSLSVGMVLFIPITPEVIPTDTASPSRTPILVTATLAPGAQQPGLVINSVIGVGDLGSERVFITRTGSGLLLLDGWKLIDEDKNTYVFPDLVLYEGGAVNIWTGSGTPTVVDLFWGQTTAVWSSGETVKILDNKGKVQATYTIP